MGLLDLGASGQQTRDSIGSEPTVHDIIKIKPTNLFVELGPIQESQETEGHAFILGSATNGLLGVNTDTEDGSQQVLGSEGMTTTVVRVLNLNNKHIERFNFTTFKDTGLTTTTWQTPTGEETNGVLIWE